MLHKKLSQIQWLSLVLLFVGISIVQLQSQDAEKAKKTLSVQQNHLLGMAAVLISCIMSGFAGVYFEKLLKNTPQSLFLRNVQLSIIGVVFGVMTMYISEREQLRKYGFYHGYDGVVWIVILLQSCGGLTVAVVIKYADNILKAFSTSAAIILACVASVYFFDFHLSMQFAFGGLLVILAVYMYSKFSTDVTAAQK